MDTLNRFAKTSLSWLPGGRKLVEAWKNVFAEEQLWILSGLVFSVLLIFFFIVLAVIRASLTGKKKPKIEKIKPFNFLRFFHPENNFIPLLDALRQLNTGNEWRYRTPWYLLIGPPNTGKSKLLSSLQLKQPQSNLLEKLKKLKVRGSQLWCFRKGVVVEMPGAFFDEEDSRQEDRQWRRLLESIYAIRSERPIDGLIITISIDELLQGKSSVIESTGERFYYRLWEIQKQYAFVLPVYVLVTQCDKLKGFSAFWKTFDSERLEEIFGWSVPYSVDAKFQIIWVDEAFQTLNHQLQQAQSLSASNGEVIEEMDYFFSFPTYFQQLQTPIRTVLEKTFLETSHHESFVLRGIYFTGESPHPPKKETSPLTDSVKVSFINQLFDKKIFAEPNIAHPTFRRVFSNNRYIRRLQTTMVIVFLALLGLLAWDGYQIDSQATSLKQSLKHIRMVSSIDDQEDANNSNVALELLQQLSEMEAQSTWRTSMLSSWIIPLDQKIVKYLTQTVFENGIFGAIAKGLSEKLQMVKQPVHSQLELKSKLQLLFDKDAAFPKIEPYLNQGGVEDTPEFQEMIAYLDRLLIFEKERSRYLEISGVQTGPSDSTADLKTLADLIQYLYQITPTSELTANSTLYQKALRHSVYRPCAINAPERQKMGCSLKVEEFFKGPERYHKHILQHLNKVGDKLFLKLVKYTSDKEMQSLGRQLDWMTETPPKNISAVQKGILASNMQNFHAWVASPSQYWITRDDPVFQMETPCGTVQNAILQRWNTLHSLYGYPSSKNILLPQYDNKNCIKIAKETLTSYRTNSLGTIMETGDEMVISSAILGMMEAIEVFSAINFPEFSSSMPRISEADTYRWDPVMLQKAIKLLHQFQTLFDKILSRLPPEWQEVVKENIHLRGQTALAKILSRARVPIEQPGSQQSLILPVATKEALIAKRVRNFRKVSPLLLELRSLLLQQSFNDLFSQVTQDSRDSVFQLLESLSELVASSRLYEVLQPIDYQGKHFTKILFNLSDEGQIDDYLSSQQQRLNFLGLNYADPLIVYLLNTQPVGIRTPSGNREWKLWQDTLVELDLLRNKNPESQPNQMALFFKNQLTELTPENCQTDWPIVNYNQMGSDWFSQARLAILEEGFEVCQNLQEQTIRDQYQSVAQQFNQTLAGRYPFSQEKTNRPGVTLEEVANFFSEYQEQRKGLEQRLFHLTDIDYQYQEPHDFIQSLNQVSDFFAATLLQQKGKIPRSVFVEADFTPMPGQTLAEEQIIRRSLLAEEQLLLDSQKPTEPFFWPYGAPFSFNLTWAQESPFLPMPLKGENFPKVIGRTITFEKQKDWALLHFIEQFTSDEDPFRLQYPNSRLLEFSIPVMPNTKGQNSNQQQGEVTVFLRLWFQGIDPETQQIRYLHIPESFPKRAPKLSD